MSFLNLLTVVNEAYNKKDMESKDGELPKYVNLILDYIETHLSGDLSLETIAEKCGISVYYMSRVFKKRTGSTIHNYVLFKRVSSAKRYISEEWPVDKVRDLCGFGTGLAFTTAFKKIVGVTPAAFARTTASGKGAPGTGESPGSESS